MRADRGASGVCYCYTMLPQLSGGTFVQMLVQMEMQTGVCDISVPALRVLVVTSSIRYESYVYICKMCTLRYNAAYQTPAIL